MIGCASCAAMANAAMIPELKPAEARVCIYLIARANRAGVCWPSVQEIGRALSLSVRKVMAATQKLAGLGFIKVQRHMRRANDYTIQDHEKLRASLPWHARTLAEPEDAPPMPDPAPAPPDPAPAPFVGIVWPDFDDLPVQPLIDAQNVSSDEIPQPAIDAQNDTSDPIIPLSEVQKTAQESRYVQTIKNRESSPESESVSARGLGEDFAPQNSPEPAADEIIPAAELAVGFVRKPDWPGADLRWVAFYAALGKLAEGWDAEGAGWRRPPGSDVRRNLRIVASTEDRIRGIEASMGVVDRETGDASFGAWNISAVQRRAFALAGIDPDRPARNTRETLVRWLGDGIEPATIYRAIEWRMGRADPPRNVRSLSFFDGVVRTQHAKDTKRADG